MSDFDRNIATARGYGADRAVAVDAGLRTYMLTVYNYMALGVGLTGVIAWFVYQAAGGDAITFTARGITGATAFGAVVLNPLVLIALVLGTFGLGIFLITRLNTLDAATARMLFFVYAAAIGLTLAPIFVMYVHGSIARVFFITAASFGALSLYGYTTQRDLSPIGSFLIMGLMGLCLAILVNIGLKMFGVSTGPMDFIISIVGVLIFAGLTAWDTQRIKEMYDVNDDGTAYGRKAVSGALMLYLDFINMFQFLLQLLGDRR